MVLAAAIVPLLASVVLAASNDWSVPCFEGECSYDHPDPAFPASLRVSGSHRSISDITPAAGWTILSCHPNALEQDVRVVCHSSDCNHLFNGYGAIDTLVRLPESCADSAFARIADVRIDDNQDIPHQISKRISYGGDRRVRTVYVLTIDSNFGAADMSRAENVSFAMDGFHASSPVPGSSISRRLLPFDHSKNFELASVNISQSKDLETSISCPDFNASLAVGVKADLTAHMSLGVHVAGQILMPHISTFQVSFHLDSNLTSQLHMNASASGTHDSGKFTLYHKSLGGFNFPGVLSVVPNFNLDGRVQVNLDVAMEFDATLSHIVNDTVMFPSPQRSGANPIANHNSIALKTQNGVPGTGNITANLIPTLSLDISAFLGILGASAYVDLDANATLALKLNGSASASDMSAEDSVDGCVKLDAGLSVNAGVDAHAGLVGIAGLEKAANVTLWSGMWLLFDKCFGGANESRRDLAPIQPRMVTDLHTKSTHTMWRRNALTCPSQKYIAPTVQVVNDVAG
ncbi:hypothetical protein DFH06DRAFT_474957 [Mycena polygramma]|nr:hypothetical protein DFH06DRAFT_474957 [Mycena polygramma]